MRDELLFGSAKHPVVMRGLDPRIHPFRKIGSFERWIAGSGPAMTGEFP
jgi:hypothetical protein